MILISMLFLLPRYCSLITLYLVYLKRYTFYQFHDTISFSWNKTSTFPPGQQGFLFIIFICWENGFPNLIFRWWLGFSITKALAQIATIYRVSLYKTMCKASYLHPPSTDNTYLPSTLHRRELCSKTGSGLSRGQNR